MLLPDSGCEVGQGSASQSRSSSQILKGFYCGQGVYHGDSVAVAFQANEGANNLQELLTGLF